MAYVPGFKYDVFISYAHVAEPVWVKEFHNKLKAHLDRELHQTGASSIFWDDQDLEAHNPLTAEITQSVSNSATLVIVLSNAYLERPWCRKEFETFFAQAGIGSRRAFLVHLEDVPLDKQPPHIAALEVSGVSFWESHPHSNKKDITRPLVPDGPEFDARIRELAKHLRNRLNELKMNPPVSSKLGAGALRPRLIGAKVFLADGIEGPRVKLLQEARMQLRNWLTEQHVEVLPDRSGALYEQFVDPTRRDDCATQVEQLMKQASICILLLGPVGSKDNFESWLCDRARAVGKSPGKDLLLWRPQSLKEANVKSAAHRALVFDPNLQIIACDLTEFQYDLAKRIEDHAIAATVRKPIDPSAAGSASPKRGLVVVDSADCDEHLSNQLMLALEQHNVCYTNVFGDLGQFTELALSGPVDGIVFTFGKCEAKWAHQRFVATRPLWISAKIRPKIAVLRADRLRPLPTNVASITIIHAADKDSVQDFVVQVREVAQ